MQPSPVIDTLRTSYHSLCRRFSDVPWKRWSKKLGIFLAGQGGVQIISMVTGFLLLRWLTPEALAQFSVAFGFQSSLGIVIDLGISSSIIALVGSRTGEPKVIGSYIRAAQMLRLRTFAVGIPVAALAFWLITARQGWPLSTQALLFGSVILSLMMAGPNAYFSAPLLMHGQLTRFYGTQATSGTARLAASALLHSLGLLTAVAASWVNALCLAFNALTYRRFVRPWIDLPEKHSATAAREILRYIAPAAPAAIFYALQGQLTIFLITIFGGTMNIAEVAALGRLTQALLLIGAFYGIIVQPYIARQAFSSLPMKYAVVVLSGIGVGAALCTLGGVFPSSMLWIIGPRYAHLRDVLLLSLLAWSLNNLAALLWTMHLARRWVFWWHTGFYIASMMVAQSIGVWKLDLGTTHGVLEFSLLQAGTALLASVIGGFYGFRQEARGRLSWQQALAVNPVVSIPPPLAVSKTKP